MSAATEKRYLNQLAQHERVARAENAVVTAAIARRKAALRIRGKESAPDAWDAYCDLTDIENATVDSLLALREGTE